MRVWDTGNGALLEADPFPASVACLRAFRAAPEGSTLSRVLVVDADTALVTGDEENRLLKVCKTGVPGPLVCKKLVFKKGRLGYSRNSTVYVRKNGGSVAITH